MGKLSPKGNCKLIRVFQSMNSQLKSCVRVGNDLIYFFNCQKGTKQGYVSSTIIFSIYINDLISYLKQKCQNGIFITNEIDELCALMFSDDVAIIADTVINLQRQLNHDEFCDATGMKIKKI